MPLNPYRLAPALALSLSLALGAGAAEACIVDYKAKQDDPLRLHYGVIDLSEAECADPEASVASRIARDGWELLTVVSELTEAQAEEKKADAGAYFLRY